MEKGFGGPVWHASVRAQWRQQQIAEDALYGVGDATLGEWRETGGIAYHIKRRLSDRECIQFGLSMIDMRDTPEGRQRLSKLFQTLPMARRYATVIGEWK
jgi:hypothetical protein